MKAILWIVALVFIGVGGWMIYNRTMAGKGYGEITNRDGSALQTDRADTGAVDSDGKPAASGDRSPDHSSDRPDGMIAPGGSTNQPPVADRTPDAPLVVPTAAPAVSAAPPTVDSMTPNAPNGLAFAGAGKFQWYRQGNLTWRLNTESGSTCIAFATIEEWKKPLVAQHGCGTA